MILYNAPSSYYSMVARLALIESNTPFTNRRMDIHIAKEQLTQWYAAINPQMTVPTLVDGKITLIDSRDILRFAATGATDHWQDSNPRFKVAIESIVQHFYAIPIEKLTFGKVLIGIPLLRLLFPKVMSNIIRKLKTTLFSNHPEAVQAKIAVTEERIAYFTQGNFLDKLNLERNRVSAFLSTLPIPCAFLFGEQISSAVIVVCVLLGRLKMIGEYALVESFAELDSWFSRMQQRSAFQAADIWQQFHLWRMLLEC